MIPMQSLCLLTCIYILVVTYLKEINELALFAWWLIITLCKPRVNVDHIILTFIGLSVSISNLRQSRERHMDDIEALITAMITHFIILSKSSCYVNAEQIHATLNKMYKKYSLYVKVWSVSLLIAAYLMFCMVFVYFLISISIAWIDNGPFNTTNSFGTVHEKFRKIGQNVDISDGDIVLSQNRFTVGEHQSSLSSSQYLTHKDVNTLPHTKHIIQAYPGEEVELKCSIRVFLQGTERVHALSFIFVQDSVEVRNSLRRIIRIPDEIIQNSSIYTLSLTLLDIRSEDFGIYRAGLRTVENCNTTCSAASITVYQFINVRDDYACVFNLSRIVDYYVYVKVPVGALLYFKQLHIHSKSDYLRVEHYVNEIPLSMMPNISSNCCLPCLYFFSEELPWLKMINTCMQQSVVFAMVCMCSSLYGIHRFKFYNDIYDIQRKIWMTSEFWHPQITVVYPTPSVMSWKSRSERESRLFDSSKNERNFSIFEGPAFELLQSNLDYDFVSLKNFDKFIIYILFPLIFLVGVLLFFCLLRLVPTLQRCVYENLGLIIRVKRPDTGGNLANTLHSRDEWQHYNVDVFVLNVDDDRPFVLNELYPILVERRLSVFFSEEHLPSGPKTDNLIRALSFSKKVIVVVSDSFINCKYYNGFFLPQLVIRRLDEGKIDSRHLMLLVAEPCLVPETLLQDNRIVTLDYTRNHKDIFLRILNEWLESPVIPEGFGQQPMLHSDLLQLYQA